MTVRSKELQFMKLTNDWVKADQECRRTYLAWQAACRKREQLAIAKNNAWGEVQMARAEEEAFK